jgi:hypothetical protein
MNHKLKLPVIAAFSVLICAVVGGFYAYGWKTDGPPLWWVMRGSEVRKVEIRWGLKRVELIDPAEVQLFRRVVVRSRFSFHYRTEFQPDELAETRIVILFRAEQKPLQIEMGVEGSEVFYEPTLDTTYYSPMLHDLVLEKVK